MSADNKNAPGKGASLAQRRAAVVIENLITETPPRQALQKRRRLNPIEGALLKLDICERRLHIANTTGDSDTWARFYLAWLKLHAVAFGYGRWVRES